MMATTGKKSSCSTGVEEAAASLLRLCLRPCCILLSDTADNIFLKFDSLEDEGCQEAIQTVQNFLGEMLPLQLYETLAAIRCNHSSSRGCTLADKVGVRWGQINVSMFLHPRLTRLSVKPIEMVTGAVNEFTTPVTDPFWTSQIERLANLTHLDLDQLATDDMLYTIGQSCRKLRAITFQPRILGSTYDIQSRNFTSGKMCVTARGLLGLLPCQNLRRVTIGQGLWRSGLHHPYARKFILGLPLLEDVNFARMGEILHGVRCLPCDGKCDDEEIKKRGPTSLKFFREIDPLSIMVSSIQLQCPKVQHITLDLGGGALERGSSSSRTERKAMSSVMQELGESSLPLRSLNTRHYPFCHGFVTFLQLKGAQLTSLVLTNMLHRDVRGHHDDTEFFNSANLETVGEHCPNLQILVIRNFTRVPQDQPQPILNLANLRQKKLFPQLKMVEIFGNPGEHGGQQKKLDYHISHVLPTLLLSAFNIEEVVIHTTRYTFMDSTMSSFDDEDPSENPFTKRYLIDGAVDCVLAHNPMLQLRVLTVSGPFCASPDAVRRLAEKCPELRLVHIHHNVDNSEPPDDNRLERSEEMAAWQLWRKSRDAFLAQLKVTHPLLHYKSVGFNASHISAPIVE